MDKILVPRTGLRLLRLPLLHFLCLLSRRMLLVGNIYTRLMWLSPPPKVVGSALALCARQFLLRLHFSSGCWPRANQMATKHEVPLPQCKCTSSNPGLHRCVREDSGLERDFLFPFVMHVEGGGSDVLFFFLRASSFLSEESEAIFQPT